LHRATVDSAAYICINKNRAALIGVQGQFEKLKSNASRLAANNVVPLDHRRNPDAFMFFVLLFIYSDNTSVSADEYFGTASDFGRQRKREIHLRAGS
jgi:hypothetical protein